jgi:cobalt-zinc-cadmium efflux system protein
MHDHHHGAHHSHGYAHGHGDPRAVSELAGHRHGDDAYRHVSAPGASRALVTALVLVASFSILEFVGGLWSGSLALMADSGHMITDAASLGFSLAANLIAQRPVSARHSYGLARAEVIAAFVNSLVLLGLVIVLVVVGVDRIGHPVAVNGEAVSIIAAGGIALNLLVAWVLSRGQQNLNVRAALLHVMSDLLGSIAALIAGIVVLTTGYTVVDPLLSMLVGGLILRSTIGVLRESTFVLLDSVPAHVDYQDVGKSLAAIPGVVSVHDLHVWSMVPGQGAVSAHLLIERIERWPAILMQARKILHRDHRIDHVTLQPECFARAANHPTIPVQPVS